MGEVVYLKDYRDLTILKGETIERPSTRKAYLAICKRFLSHREYTNILCAIIDENHYNSLLEIYEETEAKLIQDIVTNYYNFEM